MSVGYKHGRLIFFLLNSLIFLNRESQSPIIIDNTNVSFWEFKPYVQTADKFEYIVLICEPHTPWKFNADVLFGILSLTHITQINSF